MIKRWLAQFLADKLLARVTEEDILTITNKGWFLGKRKLSQEEIADLKDEARNIETSVLWKLMKQDVKWMANLRMFEKGSVDDNPVFGRAMLYNLELIEKYINRCKNL